MTLSRRALAPVLEVKALPDKKFKRQKIFRLLFLVSSDTSDY